MSELEMSIRMDSDNSVPDMPSSVLVAKPDTKGPKTIAVLLFLGSLLVLSQGLGNYLYNADEDLPLEVVGPIVDNANQNGENMTYEEYQEYHDLARESNAYLVKGVSMLVGGVLILVGSVLLFFLKSSGANMAVVGAGLSLLGGVYGSYKMMVIGDGLLNDALTMTNQLIIGVCGVLMTICLAMAGLPLINARARAAMDGGHVVELKWDQPQASDQEE